MVNVKEILKLSQAEKMTLMEEIWNSLEHNNIELTTPQRAELDRRLARYKNGTTRFYEWDEVKKDIHNVLNESGRNI